MIFSLIFFDFSEKRDSMSVFIFLNILNLNVLIYIELCRSVNYFHKNDDLYIN